MSRLAVLSMCLAVLLLFPSVARGPTNEGSPPAAKSRSSYQLRTSVISSAGSPGTSTEHRTIGTLAQPTPIGIGSSAGLVLYAGFWERLGALTAVFDAASLELLENRLLQNFPNPFNPSTTIQYWVAEENPVQITIYNVNGQKVRTLVTGTCTPGRYTTVWDGRDDRGLAVSSGLYLYRLRVGPFSSVKKMLMLK
jgi:hypothetical protein